jgi:GTP-binding protein HflX
LEKVREQLRVRKERAVLVGVNVRRRDGYKSDNLGELTALAETAGALIVDRLQQKMYRVTPKTYIGKGKAEMLGERVAKYEADVVIFDNDLSPGQIRELEEIVSAKVVDRSELILDIFATRAKTKQAKLQVELAQLQYTYPRLTRMWSHLDTVAGAAGGAGSAGAVGGIGTRGTGEKQLEIDRRLVNKRITELKRDLADIDKRKLREIDSRRGMFKICLVGYTNAGKSTLMNALTDANVFVEDRLFATLDTRTRKWTIDAGAGVLLSDTVGFVNRLPHHLVASFKATLEEAVNADLLLHVVDASSEEVFEQIESVEKVLREIGCGKKETMVLLNKSDVIRSKKVLESAQTVHQDAICISARTGLNLDKLGKAVLGRYRGEEVTVRLTADAGNGKVYSFLRANATITREEYKGEIVEFEARLSKSQVAGLKRLKLDELEVSED